VIFFVWLDVLTALPEGKCQRGTMAIFISQIYDPFGRSIILESGVRRWYFVSLAADGMRAPTYSVDFLDDGNPH